MPKYVVYYVYYSQPKYLQQKYYTSWCSIGAVLKFNKEKSTKMAYIGVSKLKGGK